MIVLIVTTILVVLIIWFVFRNAKQVESFAETAEAVLAGGKGKSLIKKSCTLPTYMEATTEKMKNTLDEFTKNSQDGGYSKVLETFASKFNLGAEHFSDKSQSPEQSLAKGVTEHLRNKFMPESFESFLGNRQSLAENIMEKFQSGKAELESEHKKVTDVLNGKNNASLFTIENVLAKGKTEQGPDMTSEEKFVEHYETKTFDLKNAAKQIFENRNKKDKRDAGIGSDNLNAKIEIVNAPIDSLSLGRAANNVDNVVNTTAYNELINTEDRDIYTIINSMDNHLDTEMILRNDEGLAYVDEYLLSEANVRDLERILTQRKKSSVNEKNIETVLGKGKLRDELLEDNKRYDNKFRRDMSGVIIASLNECNAEEENRIFKQINYDSYYRYIFKLTEDDPVDYYDLNTIDKYNKLLTDDNAIATLCRVIANKKSKSKRRLGAVAVNETFTNSNNASATNKAKTGVSEAPLVKHMNVARIGAGNLIKQVRKNIPKIGKK